MKKFRILPWILAVVLVTGASTPGARAGDINGPAMAGLVLNNTIPDGDFYALTLLAGSSPMDVLNTNSTDTSTGFTQTLAGTYAGQALNVTYTGNSTAFPAGAITWTSTGSYGAQAWTSSGDATFTFPTSSTFQIAYSSSLTLGPNTVLENSTISGADNGTSLDYTGTTGTLTVNNIPIPTGQFTQVTFLDLGVGSIILDDYEVNGELIICSISEVTNVSPDPPSPPGIIGSTGRIQESPEPSSLFLAGVGFLSLIVGCAARRPRKAGDPKPRPCRFFGRPGSVDS